MDTTYRLTQTGLEVQHALDQVEPIEAAIVALNAGKVDKVEGKGLSHNDFTDADVEKLGNLPSATELNQVLATKQNVIDDLATIRSGAEAGAAAAPQATTYTKTEVDAAIADFITRTVNNLTNYYLKSETYTQAEVQQLIAAVKQFRYQSVAELPTASAETMGIIYLVPSANPSAQNVKDEFITVSTTNEQQVTTYAWEQIGSTAVDLSGYYTSAQTDAAITAALNVALASYSTTAQMNSAIAAALAPYYTKAEIDALLAGKQDVINDLATIRSQAAAAAPQATTYTKTEVDAAIADFITRTVNNLTNYYLKSETYTQAEVQQLIAAVKQFRYMSVAELPTASAETMGIIYLVPSAQPTAQNVKDEYITVSTTNEQQVTTYAWECIGSTTIDLSNYPTTAQMNAAIATALASYYTSTQVDTLLAGKLGTSETAAAATKLATARTLWGQSFDGTANVTGNLSNVGSLAMNGVLSGARGEIKGVLINALYGSSASDALAHIVARQTDTDTYTYSNDIGTLVTGYRSDNGHAVINSSMQCVVGHKYASYGVIASSTRMYFGRVHTGNGNQFAVNQSQLINNDNEYHVYLCISTLPCNQSTWLNFWFEQSNNATIRIKALGLFDLTAMFGAGLEPTTTDEFARRLGYASIDDVPYIPYAATPIPLNDAMAVGGDLIVKEKIAALKGPLNIVGSEVALSEGLHIKYDATTNTVTFCDASGTPSKIVYDDSTT